MRRLVQCLAPLAFVAALISPALADDAPSFDGRWEGVIHFDKEAFLAETSTPAAGKIFRIEIHDVVVRVYVKEGDSFSEVKPGVFHIAAVEGNAVIFATDAASDGAWVESWVFTVTHKDDHTLLVEYTRLVNNLPVPASEPEGKFAARGEGDLARTAP